MPADAAASTNGSGVRTYEYRGNTLQGQHVSGTIDATDHDQAAELLRGMQVNVIELRATAEPRVTRKITGVDFLAFNEQLAAMTRAGVPVERGLRLIAAEMRSGAMAETVKQIADEAERGIPLGQAFDRHRGKFPPLYGKLIDAGIRANNLPAMLLSLGRHISLVQRLRAALWQAMAYPLIVFIFTCGVSIIMGVSIFPQMEKILDDFNTELPALTKVVMLFGRHATTIGGSSLSAALLAVIIWRVLRTMRLEGYITDGIGLQFPLIGPVLRHGLVARWCDAVRLGILGGFDLPESIRIAHATINSPALEHDAKILIAEFDAGRSLSDARGTVVIGRSITTPIDIAIHARSLPDTLELLSQLHERQATARIGVILTVVPIVLTLLLGVAIGFIVISVLLPLFSGIQSLT